MHVSVSVLVSQEVLQMIPKFCFPFDVERYNSALLACVFVFFFFLSTCTSLSPSSHALTWLLFHLHKQLEKKKKMKSGAFLCIVLVKLDTITIS